MIYLCDFKVNSLPNQTLLYEKRYNIISDTFDKHKIFKAVFQKEFSYLFQKERENGHYRHQCHEIIEVSQIKKQVIIFHNFRLPHLIQ